MSKPLQKKSTKTFSIPHDLHTDLKVMAAKSGVKLGVFIVSVIRAGIKTGKGRV